MSFFFSLFLLAFCAVMKEREARAKRPKEKRKRKTTHFSLSVPSCVLFAFLFLSLIFNVMEWSVMKREISERKGNTKDTEKNHTNSYILWSESYCCVLCVYFSFNLIRAFIAIKLNRKGKQRTQLIHHRLTLDLWFAKDNRFLNPKSSYKRILMAPPCRLIPFVLSFVLHSLHSFSSHSTTHYITPELEWMEWLVLCFNWTKGKQSARFIFNWTKHTTHPT